jgi:hypothetical protein
MNQLFNTAQATSFCPASADFGVQSSFRGLLFPNSGFSFMMVDGIS